MNNQRNAQVYKSKSDLSGIELRAPGKIIPTNKSSVYSYSQLSLQMW